MAIDRLLPLSGIVFVALVLVALVGLGGATPEPNAPGAEVAAFYGDQAWRQALGALVLAASVPFLLFFAGRLAEFAWPAERADRLFWRRVLLGGSFILGAVLMLGALAHFALADAGDQDLSPQALEALNALDGSMWVPSSASLGVMMLGAAGWLLGRVGTYGWLGWAALVLGVALFLPYAGFFALLLSLVWIIVVSALLYRDSRGTAA